MTRGVRGSAVIEGATRTVFVRRVAAIGLNMFLAWGLMASPAAAAPPADPVDLASDGGRSRALSVPVVVVVSRADCSYCQWLRENVLDPSRLDPSYADRAVIRELFIDNGDSLVDFDGVERAAEVIARRYDARFTPTVLFLDDRGEQLVAAIRGVASKDFYAYYFDESVDQAASMLKGRQ